MQVAFHRRQRYIASLGVLLSTAHQVVFPPGPYPPHGSEQPGTIDLGIRVRDQLLRREVIEGAVRQELASRLSAVARAGRLAMSPHLVDALVDTWPLAAMIDEAREQWIQGPDLHALTIIERGMKVVSMALGWPETIDRRWPMPDLDWILRQVGEGSFVVQCRGDRDGAPAVAAALGCELVPRPAKDAPAILRVQGDELTAKIDDIMQSMQSQEIRAVHFETPVPWDNDSRDALTLLESEFKVQRAFRRHGLVGLAVEDCAEEFRDLLATPPPGRREDKPIARCDALMVPRTDNQGRSALAGVLVWREPYRPMWVHPFAIELLQQLNGQRDKAQLLKQFELDEPTLDGLLDQLQELGAI